MIHAARGLVKVENDAIDEDEDRILAEFRRRYCDTGIFHDRYAGSKFAGFLFKAREEAAPAAGWEATRQRIEEAQLFIDAAHSCYGRLKGARAVP